MRTNIIETKNKIGEKVELFGWVHGRRDHGKIIFIDLRDRSGMAQVVFTPHNKEVYKIANKLRSEWVVHLKGKVNARPEKMVNPELETGMVEIEPISLEIINEAEALPFPIDTDG